MPFKKQLCRSESDRMIAGVCGGIAEYFELDSSLVRFLFILIILLGGSGLFIYVILWTVLPPGADPAEIKGEIMGQTISDKVDKNMRGKSRKNVWGIFLIGLGIVMLLQNFGVARLLYLDKSWPAILVILGLLVMSRGQISRHSLFDFRVYTPCCSA